MTANAVEQVPRKRGFRMPDIYIVLAVFIVVVAVLTYIIPAGQYDRQSVETMHGTQNLVVAGSYHRIEQHPAGAMDLVTAIPDGLKRGSSVVFLTFMVGGCIGLIRRAGLVELGIHKLSGAIGEKGFLVIPILIAVFATIAAFIGTPELSLAYLPMLLPLFYRLGYDGMTATAVCLLGPCIGFAYGVTIPASVGLGQQLAQVKMFSGSEFRAVILVIMVLLGIIYVMRYAAKVKKSPEKSLTYETDKPLYAKLQGEQANAGALVFTSRQSFAGIVCLILFPLAIVMILWKNLGFEAIGGMFLFIGIAAAAIAGKGPQQICDDVNAGMRDMMVGALLCGIASSIAVVMDKGVITDTLVFWLESMMRSVPPAFTAIAIFWEQSLFNFLIPGATALTMLTMPIIAPLSSLLGVELQAAISANAWGGQITDIFFPTSGFFVATLAIAKVEYGKWLRFYTPLMLVFGLVCSIALYLMQVFKLGL